jgi:MoaA/NifB/PqqE/SkfB family radical SAM enzyme
MFQRSDYVTRGYQFLHNRLLPARKKLSSLMLYTTDLCDSGCKHCLIWAKRPVTHLALDKIQELMQSDCIDRSTMVGLEGGEFLLHPEADQILDWFTTHHPNFDLFSNGLKPDRLLEAVKKNPPRRLYISLDGDEDTYRYMRGKDGYQDVVRVIQTLKNKIPVFVMFTLSPYNDFEDLEHVAEICQANQAFLRVGIYNNIPFFDTLDDAKQASFGGLKDKQLLTLGKINQIRASKLMEQAAGPERPAQPLTAMEDYRAQIPTKVKAFQENYDYISLYQNWLSGNLRLKCYSILDSLIILPDGSVPICQNLDLKLGNIHQTTLDELFNGPKARKLQQHYSQHCNQCWISYHRKYDIALFRTFEKYFGKWATGKMLGYYKWDSDDRHSYRDLFPHPKE